MKIAKIASIIFFIVLFIFAGVMHFARADMFMRATPPWLPYPLEVIYLSGVCEILGGIGLMLSRFRRAAAICLALLLVCVFPVNIHMALHPEIFPEIPRWALYLRLPFQPLWIVLILWATKPAHVGGAKGGSANTLKGDGV